MSSLQISFAQATPYILFTLGQVVAFVIWIVNLQTKITEMKGQIVQLGKDKHKLEDSMVKEKDKQDERNSFFMEKINEALQALKSAEKAMEFMLLKGMKTNKA